MMALRSTIGACVALLSARQGSSLKLSLKTKGDLLAKIENSSWEVDVNGGATGTATVGSYNSGQIDFSDGSDMISFKLELNDLKTHYVLTDGAGHKVDGKILDDGARGDVQKIQWTQADQQIAQWTRQQLGAGCRRSNKKRKAKNALAQHKNKRAAPPTRQPLRSIQNTMSSAAESEHSGQQICALPDDAEAEALSVGLAEDADFKHDEDRERSAKELTDMLGSALDSWNPDGPDSSSPLLGIAGMEEPLETVADGPEAGADAPDVELDKMVEEVLAQQEDEAQLVASEQAQPPQRQEQQQEQESFFPEWAAGAEDMLNHEDFTLLSNDALVAGVGSNSSPDWVDDELHKLDALTDSNPSVAAASPPQPPSVASTLASSDNLDHAAPNGSEVMQPTAEEGQAADFLLHALSDSAEEQIDEEMAMLMNNDAEFKALADGANPGDGPLKQKVAVASKVPLKQNAQKVAVAPKKNKVVAAEETADGQQHEEEISSVSQMEDLSWVVDASMPGGGNRAEDQLTDDPFAGFMLDDSGNSYDVDVAESGALEYPEPGAAAESPRSFQEAEDFARAVLSDTPVTTAESGSVVPDFDEMAERAEDGSFDLGMAVEQPRDEQQNASGHDVVSLEQAAEFARPLLFGAAEQQDGFTAEEQDGATAGPDVEPLSDEEMAKLNRQMNNDREFKALLANVANPEDEPDSVTV